MKDDLYLIAGRSMAGKDTVTDIVCRKTGLKKVVSFTDAPIRSDQEEGREHYFLTSEKMSEMLENKQDDILAYTKIGKTGYRYCAMAGEIDDVTKLYIIDPAGIRDLTERFGDRYDITVFYVTAPEDVRLKRGSVRQNFDMAARLKGEDEQFTEFEQNGSYIKIDNSADEPEIAACAIAEHIAGKTAFKRVFQSSVCRHAMAQGM